MAATCPDGTSGPSPEGKCYAASPTSQTFQNSLIYCASLNLNSAIIASPAESAFYVNSIGVDRAYIGISDQAVEGTWVWVATGTPSTYHNWDSGEPSGGTSENCAEIYANGKWNDIDCSSMKKALCMTCPINYEFSAATLTCLEVIGSTMPPTFVPTTSPSSAPSFSPSLSPSVMPSVYPSLSPTANPSSLPSSAPSVSPSLSPTALPSSAPSASPTAFFPTCSQLISLDDSHGSYDLWMTSFVKLDGYFSSDGDDWAFHSGYIPFWELIGPDFEWKPFTILGLTPGPGATFSVVGGKLDANGFLMPCDIESEASGACFETRSWEIGLGAKSLFNSFFTTETAAWIAPFGSSMSNECFMDTEWPMDETNTRLRPVAFTGEGRSHNNVPPSSFHVPPPLPHESVELSLTLKDGGGKGWWNTLKFHPNQYVLDDGEAILHRGTLVDKAEVTEKIRLRKDGSYHLRMLGHLDVDAGDDSWSLMLGDLEVASGGRYDRVSFTLNHGSLSSVTPENVMDLFETHSASPFPLAAFEGLVTSQKLYEMTHDPILLEAEIAFFQKSGLLQSMNNLSPTTSDSSFTFTDSLTSHPLEYTGFFIASAFLGMATVMGITRFLSPSKIFKKYDSLMDDDSEAQMIPSPAVIELEKSPRLTVQSVQL